MRRHLPTASTDSEEGFTLVELLVTVTIMAIAFIAIMSALLVFLRGTATHRASAELDQAMRTYVEQLATQPYVKCATQSDFPAPPTGFTRTVSVTYWNGASPAVFGSGCTQATDKGAQQLTVTLTRTANGQSDRLVVVKRSA